MNSNKNAASTTPASAPKRRGPRSKITIGLEKCAQAGYIPDDSITSFISGRSTRTVKTYRKLLEEYYVMTRNGHGWDVVPVPPPAPEPEPVVEMTLTERISLILAGLPQADLEALDELLSADPRK